MNSSRREILRRWTYRGVGFGWLTAGTITLFNAFINFSQAEMVIWSASLIFAGGVVLLASKRM